MKFENGLKSSRRKKSADIGAAGQGQTAEQTLAPKPSSTTSETRKPVTIEARIDVGFGNRLFMRGEGQGLSWTQGIPLSCVDNSVWKWSGQTAEKLKFKLLLNDSVWSKGEDLEVRPGERLEVEPAF